MKSIMKQCQSLDLLEWNVSFNNDELLEIMQHKIKDLKELTINHYDDHNKSDSSNYRNNNIRYYGYYRNNSINRYDDHNESDSSNNIECFGYF
ncbi:hypothetical protein RclHR1_00020050 [Rhizophagus clarus]|nr:hypothetical protein RclHR1_00020050 [Rhizophagus clarus]